MMKRRTFYEIHSDGDGSSEYHEEPVVNVHGNSTVTSSDFHVICHNITKDSAFYGTMNQRYVLEHLLFLTRRGINLWTG